MAGRFLGCFSGNSKRREPKKRKIRYEGIELGGKGLHRMECSTPMPDENELNAKFAELVVSGMLIVGICSRLNDASRLIVYIQEHFSVYKSFTFINVLWAFGHRIKYRENSVTNRL